MRLAIVDDERLVRYHIRCLVAEADPSIEIIEAENGRDFADLAAARRVDAAMVDIRMPKMDGLQAMRQLSEEGKAVPWAVLSSHSEFEYARRALELGALGYALKPPSKEEIAQLVAKLRGAAARAARENGEAFERDWRRLVRGAASSIPSAAEGSLFSAALIAVDGAPAAADPKARLTEIGRLAVSRAGRYAERGLRAAAVPEDGTAFLEIGLCAEPWGESGLDAEAIRRFWSEFAAAAAGGFGAEEEPAAERPMNGAGSGAPPARIALFATACARDPVDARTGLSAARSALGGRALLPPGATAAADALRALASFGTADAEAASSVARAVTAVAERDRSALRAAVSSYSSAVRSGIGERAGELLVRFVDRVLPGRGATLAEASGAAFLEACEDAIACSAGQAVESDGDTIDAVEEFVRRRFAERLSLAEIARIFGLTPNYLSALFHRRVGMTFVEYATELRLSRARDLLRSGKSVKEAAWAVGYGSERHFARLYRRRFGSPPAREKRSKSPPAPS